MTEYEFTLKFSLPVADADPSDYVEALTEAGCDDALVGIGQGGRIALAFTRSARSAWEAVTTALRDVRNAIPEATLVEASPDFVGLTDVADIAGFSRQNMRKLMVGSPTFPAAVHEGKPALWHLAVVLAWLRERKAQPVDATLFEVAQANMAVNIAKEARLLKGVSLSKELDALFR